MNKLTFTLKKNFFILTLILTLDFEAFAQSNEKPKVAFCQRPEGCVFYDHPFSYKQLDLMFNYLGDYENRKGILTFVTDATGERMNYPDRKRSPKELNEYFGGKGEPLVVPWSLSIHQNIQPEDGKWTIANEKPQVRNCPKGVETQLEKARMIESGNKVFDKPFSPFTLLPAREAKWFPVEPNIYKCILQLTESDVVTTVYDVKVLTPKTMEGTMNYTFKIPNLPTCRIKVNFKYTKN
ncbi:hypothetical protein [Emticicia sp. BO119]|uniref:hypothetical protein n=1 Tax=Emticicia sp. BO119 TaxID=2757768 RepID=UPI0015F000A2|nr:hypothetical protein [Emticicia sp. BO119]MBA4848955.1 hypothetical protein [Emticicia sp. BO119]